MNDRGAARALVMMAALVQGCGGASASGPGSSSSGSSAVGSSGAPTAPSRQDQVAAGCAPTWEEALLRVGPLTSWEIPQTRGYSLAQGEEGQPEPDVPWTEVCHYPQGDCRAIRYESACVVHVDYRCGEPSQLAAERGGLPCDRPQLP
ncbi:MAG: hypothetical protein K1X94_31575 [Sandaracinaceae bacterium]|nr:hypothetical protein [Sandaracinaceae bacterium]